MKRHRSILISLSLSILAAILSSQSEGTQPNILTAGQFFANVSANYATIKDYEGSVSVQTSKASMAGKVIYKSPNLLRMDFAEPANQVILFNGSEMLIYVPSLNAILRQASGQSGAGAAGIASGEGLRLLSNGYTITFVKSPEPEPLDPGSAELVINLLLSRKTVAEGYRTLVLSVNPETLLIRRMRGEATTGETITLDFTGIQTNINLPDTRFLYDTPSTANSFNNFILNSGN